MGMRVSLTGVITRSAKALRERGEAGHDSAFMLEELHRHLKELRDRHAAGDPGVVAEFFNLYVIEE